MGEKVGKVSISTVKAQDLNGRYKCLKAPWAKRVVLWAFEKHMPSRTPKKLRASYAQYSAGESSRLAFRS